MIFYELNIRRGRKKDAGRRGVRKQISRWHVTVEMINWIE